MFQEFYQGSPHLIWPLVGLGIFFLTFLGVLLYVGVVLRNNPVVEKMASLPLEDDDIVQDGEVEHND